MGSNGFDKAMLDESFPVAGVDPSARAETLSTTDFVRLTAALAQSVSATGESEAR